jgi:hypothetical protein
MKNPQKSKFHRSIAWLLDANIISLVSTVNYDMSRSETVMFTAVYVGIWSFHGTYSTGNTGSIWLYTARQHTAVIRRIRNGCSTARLRSYCNVHERTRHSERLDTVVYDRRNARPGYECSTSRSFFVLISEQFLVIYHMWRSLHHLCHLDLFNALGWILSNNWFYHIGYCTSRCFKVFSFLSCKVLDYQFLILLR